MRSVSEILDLRASLNESRFSALFAELDIIRRELRALPGILAEMLAERSKSG